MLRRLTAASLVLGLQVGAWSAPWLHAHLDEHDADHHHGHVIHSHLPPHASSFDAPRVPPHETGVPDVAATDDEISIALQVFVAVQPHPVTTAATVSAVFTLPTPRVRAAKVPAPPAGCHDPPPLTSRSSRAPPQPTLS